jgi:hypothetical protein
MKAQAPNYLYPLATTRQLQWTKDVVKGEGTAKQPIRPKRFSAAKKEIIHRLVKNQALPARQTRTRNILNPMMKAALPLSPMRVADPVLGNAMHIANTREAYNEY